MAGLLCALTMTSALRDCVRESECTVATHTGFSLQGAVSSSVWEEVLDSLWSNFA